MSYLHFKVDLVGEEGLLYAVVRTYLIFIYWHSPNHFFK